MENFAAEGTEVLGWAIGVGALDAGNTFGIVAALTKAFDGPGDPLPVRASQTTGVLSLAAGGKLGEVTAEETLQ